MRKKIAFIVLAIFIMIPRMTRAGNFIEDLQMKARVGYSIGGTAPVGIPATIRSIDAFRLTPSFMVGLDIALPLKDRWGVMTGLHFENKAMNADVTTKAYRMELRKGNELIEGLFTGKVKQKVTEWMLTLPIMGTCQLGSNVQLKAGPYFSLLLNEDFSGIASDGYLRQGNPTGPKIIIGAKEGEWATYDFTEEMRNLQFGLAAGIDCQVYRQIGVSADLSWGLTGIFKSSFKTVEQTLYPIYGTIGIYYKL